MRLTSTLTVAGITAACLAVIGIQTAYGLSDRPAPSTPGPASTAPPSTAPTPPLAVTAFQTSNSNPDLINRSAKAITTVGVDGVSLNPQGGQVSKPDSGALRQLARAHKLGLRAELLVSNWSDKKNDFDEKIAHRLLAHPKHRSAVAHALALDVTKTGFDGISIDLEALTARDTPLLTKFVEKLDGLLPQGATLSICVSARTHAAAYAQGGYPMRALAANTDRVILMAYDEHGPWENTPGPIGALAWEKASLHAALQFVPADKLDLGVAGYGYGWRPHRNVTLTDAKARQLAGDKAHFDPKIGEWTAKLADGSTLWWSDHRSYLLRAALARSMHLHGLAVWSLRQSDPLT